MPTPDRVTTLKLYLGIIRRINTQNAWYLANPCYYYFRHRAFTVQMLSKLE